MFGRWTAVGLVMSAIILTPLAAQTADWYGPYQRGRAAVAAERWEDAIANLSAAMKVDAKCEQHKHVEGVFTDDYCPQLYLIRAYIGANRLDAAADTLDSATAAGVPRGLSSAFEVARQDLAAARGRAAFDHKADQAIQLLVAHKNEEALSAFDALRAADPAGFDRRELSIRRGQTVSALTSELVQAGKRFVVAGRLDAAGDTFRRASILAPDSLPARDGLAAVASRRAEYARFKASAATQLDAKAFQRAADDLRAARLTDLDQFRRDGLYDVLETAVRGFVRDQIAATKANGALISLKCDVNCSVSVDSGMSLVVVQGQPRPIAVEAGNHSIVARSGDGQGTWEGTVTVATHTNVEVDIPMAARVRDASAALAEDRQTRAEIDRLRTEIARLDGTRQQLDASTVRLKQQAVVIQTRPQVVVGQIRELEAQIARELAQADQDLKDAQDASTMATQLPFGSSRVGQVTQAAAAILAEAKKASAAHHREHAQQMVAQISNLSHELYLLTVR
jgi:hypothetical protein